MTTATRTFTMNGKTYEIYNETNDMIHCVKLGMNGKRLSHKNAANLLNFNSNQYTRLRQLGVIKNWHNG